MDHHTTMCDSCEAVAVAKPTFDAAVPIVVTINTSPSMTDGIFLHDEDESLSLGRFDSEFNNEGPPNHSSIQTSDIEHQQKDSTNKYRKGSNQAIQTSSKVSTSPPPGDASGRGGFPRSRQEVIPQQHANYMTLDNPVPKKTSCFGANKLTTNENSSFDHVSGQGFTPGSGATTPSPRPTLNKNWNLLRHAVRESRIVLQPPGNCGPARGDGTRMISSQSSSNTSHKNWAILRQAVAQADIISSATENSRYQVNPPNSSESEGYQASTGVQLTKQEKNQWERNAIIVSHSAGAGFQSLESSGTKNWEVLRTAVRESGLSAGRASQCIATSSDQLLNSESLPCASMNVSDARHNYPKKNANGQGSVSVPSTAPPYGHANGATNHRALALPLNQKQYLLPRTDPLTGGIRQNPSHQRPQVQQHKQGTRREHEGHQRETSPRVSGGWAKLRRAVKDGKLTVHKGGVDWDVSQEARTLKDRLDDSQASLIRANETESQGRHKGTSSSAKNAALMPPRPLDGSSHWTEAKKTLANAGNMQQSTAPSRQQLKKTSSFHNGMIVLREKEATAALPKAERTSKPPRVTGGSHWEIVRRAVRESAPSRVPSQQQLCGSAHGQEHKESAEHHRPQKMAGTDAPQKVESSILNNPFNTRSASNRAKVRGAVRESTCKTHTQICASGKSSDAPTRVPRRFDVSETQHSAHYEDQVAKEPMGFSGLNTSESPMRPHSQGISQGGGYSSSATGKGGQTPNNPSSNNMPKPATAASQNWALLRRAVKTSDVVETQPKEQEDGQKLKAKSSRHDRFILFAKDEMQHPHSSNHRNGIEVRHEEQRYQNQPPKSRMTLIQANSRTSQRQSLAIVQRSDNTTRPSSKGRCKIPEQRNLTNSRIPPQLQRRVQSHPYPQQQQQKHFVHTSVVQDPGREPPGNPGFPGKVCKRATQQPGIGQRSVSAPYLVRARSDHRHTNGRHFNTITHATASCQTPAGKNLSGHLVVVTGKAPFPVHSTSTRGQSKPTYVLPLHSRSSPSLGIHPQHQKRSHANSSGKHQQSRPYTFSSPSA